ncbi:MAG: hypothetical protein WAW37_13830 [Syntrophobacteraceae bacterium]
MVWLEMISIRTAGTIETGRVFDICRDCRQSVASGELLQMIVYFSARYETDISIHLQWKSEPGPGSILGLGMISAMRNLGLISHTVWVEREELITGAQSQTA